jgi:hypothetical protein
MWATAARILRILRMSSFLLVLSASRAHSRKEFTMTQGEKKVLYTARDHTGGRDGGGSRSSDGRLDVKFSVPGNANLLIGASIKSKLEFKT